MSKCRSPLIAGRGTFRSCTLLRPLSPWPTHPDPTGELQQQVRHHFEAQRGVREAEQIKYLLSDGKQQLKRLREMIGLASGTL